MNIARMYTIALGSFGYTEDEARFIYLVAALSGYFTCQQFLRFVSGKPGTSGNISLTVAADHSCVLLRSVDRR